MKTKSSPPKVTCTMWGNLQLRGRLLKQIATLQQAGIPCRVVYGDSQELDFDPNHFNFPVDVIPTPSNCHPLILFLRQIIFCWKASRKIADSDATHVLCLSMETVLAGVLAKRLRPGLKVVFDSNELHIEHYINPVKRQLWNLVKIFCVRSCDVIMHAEQNRLEYFKKHHDPNHQERTYFLLENFPYYVEPSRLEAKPATPPVRVLYVGVMGKDRFTLELVDIFRELAPDYTLDLVGNMKPKFRQQLEAKLAEQPNSNITLHDAIPYGEMSTLMQRYHVGIALYTNDNLNNYYCAPNKVYDYIMNNMAVITNDYPGLQKVMNNGEAGMCISKVDLVDFRDSLHHIVKNEIWNKITDDKRRKHSWEDQTDAYLKLFN